MDAIAFKYRTGTAWIVRAHQLPGRKSGEWATAGESDDHVPDGPISDHAEEIAGAGVRASKTGITFRRTNWSRTIS
jgi:hypothetical protein